MEMGVRINEEYDRLYITKSKWLMYIIPHADMSVFAVISSRKEGMQFITPVGDLFLNNRRNFLYAWSSGMKYVNPTKACDISVKNPSSSNAPDGEPTTNDHIPFPLKFATMSSFMEFPQRIVGETASVSLS